MASVDETVDPFEDAAHLLQYRVDGEQRTTVACARHRADLLAELRAENLGVVGMSAPESATCDGCRTEAMSA